MTDFSPNQWQWWKDRDPKTSRLQLVMSKEVLRFNFLLGPSMYVPVIRELGERLGVTAHLGTIDKIDKDGTRWVSIGDTGHQAIRLLEGP